MNAPEPGSFNPPDPVAALGGLEMGLADAMRTQRAVRRLHTEPVPHEVLLPLLELALQAPTSSNSQDWAFVVVEDRAQKAAIGRLYRRMFSLYDPIVRRLAKDDPQALRNMAPGRWQAENFADLPVLVIPCYRRSAKHKPTGRPQIAVSSFYGSVYPAVQNLLLGCRAAGLGASLQTIPIWWVRGVRKALGLPRDITPVCLIPIGWARGRYGPTTRPPIGEVVHLDRWGHQPFA